METIPILAPAAVLVLAKVLAHWLVTGLPLILVTWVYFGLFDKTTASLQ